jgi:hypothetical protein
VTSWPYYWKSEICPSSPLYWCVGVGVIRHWPQQRSPHHKRRNIESNPVLGGFGCVHHLEEIGFGLAGRVPRVLPCGVLWRDGDRLGQINADNKILVNAVIENAIRSRWIYALPAPIFFALNGTLVFKWFSEFDESAAMAANFVVSSLVLIPVAVATSNFSARISEQSALAILLLLFGTLASAAAGRVFYQIALTATQNDNGYVTMFFLLTPVLTPLISLPLSRWMPDLQFVAGPLFFIGMALVIVALFLFLLMTWRGAHHGAVKREGAATVSTRAGPRGPEGAA